MSNTPVPSQTSLLEKVKNIFNPSFIESKFNLSKDALIEIGLYAGMGFLLGFLVKKYNKIVFAAVFFSVVLTLLQHLDLVSITLHWENIQSFFGIRQPTIIHEGATQFATQWLKTNMRLAISLGVGFIIGLKLG